MSRTAQRLTLLFGLLGCAAVFLDRPISKAHQGSADGRPAMISLAAGEPMVVEVPWEREQPDMPARGGGSHDTAGRIRTKTIRMLVTAYCPCRRCCGRHSDGMTASGRRISANGSMFVAADTRILPFGTRVSVPGYYDGAPVEVLDRGGRIKGRRLDVFFRSHRRATKWGVRRLDVTVYLTPR